MPITFSFSVLFTLLAVLAVSGRMFYVLTKQWTNHRPLEALREWGRDRGFKLLMSPDAELPASLEGLASLNPQVAITLRRGLVTFVSLTTGDKTWNLLIVETQQPHNPAGLRPAVSATSFLDLFSMNGYPSLTPPDRFVAFANDVKDARQLANSPARGLLPADIGLLTHGPFITLDFSTRPFDVIEFDRMLTIMDQLRQSGV